MQIPRCARMTAMVDASRLAPFAQKSHQFQETVDHQTKPEIDQGTEVNLERVMLGGWWQIRVEGEIQPVAKQYGDQVFEPFHRYGFHLSITSRMWQAVCGRWRRALGRMGSVLCGKSKTGSSPRSTYDTLHLGLPTRLLPPATFGFSPLATYNLPSTSMRL